MKPPKVELVVRRGALRRFDALKQATADLEVAVVWDRRTGGPSPRKTERRQKPAFTWDLADFVVVEKTKSSKKKR